MRIFAERMEREVEDLFRVVVGSCEFLGCVEI